MVMLCEFSRSSTGSPGSEPSFSLAQMRPPMVLNGSNQWKRGRQSVFSSFRLVPMCLRSTTWGLYSQNGAKSGDFWPFSTLFGTHHLHLWNL